jgi:hypothetical protein
MTAPTYVLNVDGVAQDRTPEEVAAGLRLLDTFMEPQAVIGKPLDLEIGSVWIDYAEIALLALILVTLVVIALKL